MPGARSRRLVWLSVGCAAILAILLLASSWGGSGGAPSNAAVTPPQATSAAPGERLATEAFSPQADEVVSLAWRLALAGAVIGAALVGLRWWGRRLATPASQTGMLRILDTVAIGGGRTVHLLEAGERVLVIGATAQQISLLGEVEQSALLPALSRRSESPEAFAQSLIAALRSSTDRGGEPARRSGP